MEEIEDRLRKEMDADARAFEPSAAAWDRIQAGLSKRRVSRTHVAMLVSVVVLAAGGVVGIRLVNDSPKERLRIVNPPLAAPTIITPPPLPSISASPTASSSPTTAPDESAWVSPDGAWTVYYPKTWFFSDAGESSWRLTSFDPSKDSGPHEEGAIGIALMIRPNTQNLAMDDLLKSYCDESADPESDVLDCGTVEYGGHTWVWMLGHTQVEGGRNGRLAGTILDGKIYEAAAAWSDGSSASSANGTVEGLYRDFVVRD